MHDERQYHRRREQHCREQAASATDPAIRKCHEQLADLHAAAAQRGSFEPAATAAAA